MQIVRFVRFIRLEHDRDRGSESEGARVAVSTKRVAGKRRGQIKMASDFDDPIEDSTSQRLREKWPQPF